nr:hypothetical protein [Tanacetum cinerariifolium]
RQARRKAKIVESDEEVNLEDPSKQGRSMIKEIDQDAEVTLTYTRRRAVSTGSSRVSTASRMISTAKESVSIAGASMPISTAEQERLGLETAMRLQEQFDEEERQRMARVHAAAQTFTEEEWENIKARVEADEKLTQRLQAEEKDKYNQIEDFSESNKEFYSIDDDSFSIDDIDYIKASPPDSELVSSEVMEIVIPEVGGINDDILLMIKDDDLREKLRNVNLLISKIEALNANPTPSSDCKIKSSSTCLNSLLEETNTFDNSLPDSGSPTTPDISLSEYDSFMFDLLINPFPLADMSDSYELTDELIPFKSAPEYDCFRFTVEPNSKDFTKDVVETISPTKEPQVLTVLPTHPTLQLNLKFLPSSESLFAYVVWIFLPFLVYSVVPCYLLSLRTEDIIFDPGIYKYHFSKPDISHRCGTVKKFNTHRSHLNTFPMLINGQNNPPLDVLLFHFYPP